MVPVVQEHDDLQLDPCCLFLQEEKHRIRRKTSLYDMAMKLWMEWESIKKQFLVRRGELHIIFCALGKCVEGSGIDQKWVEGELCSPTTQ